MYSQKFTTIICFIVFLLNFQSCEKIADSIFTDADDIELGKSIDTEIRSNPDKYRISENVEVRSYVQSIIKQLVRSPAIKKKKSFSYRVTILEDENIINAFCTPGGYIYVYTGLLKFLENEATLAAVLAHEIAHAEKRHVRQRMLSNIGVNLIISALVGQNSSVLKEIGLQIAGSLALLSNSRSDELEADELGFVYMQSSPYYQGAMSYFFEKIAKEEKDKRIGGAMESLLSTHPIPEDRLKANTLRIQKKKIQPPIPSNLLQLRYEKFKTKYLSSEIKKKSNNSEDKG